MNVLFLLTPKSEVDYICDTATLIQTLDVMSRHNYTAIPMINRKGRYVGTITEGDIIGCIRENYDLSLEAAKDIPIKSLKRSRDNAPVNVEAKIEDLITVAINQNFVPVVDDDNKFIGIVKRKDIMGQYINKIANDKN
jgi:CBS domain-containing protein